MTLLNRVCRCPASDNEVIEIRQVHDMLEFPPEVQQALQDSRRARCGLAPER